MRQGYQIIAAALIMAVLAGTAAACSAAAGLYIGKDGTYYRREDGKNHTGFLRTEEGSGISARTAGWRRTASLK